MKDNRRSRRRTRPENGQEYRKRKRCRVLEEGKEEGAKVLCPGQDKDRLKKPEEDKDEEDPQEKCRPKQRERRKR